MATIKIPNAEIEQLLSGVKAEFPKYTTQIMNLANSNAQGTRPRVVGQMSDLIQEFTGKSLDEWVEFYGGKMPNGIDNATEKIYPMIELFKEAITKIDKEMVRQWVGDLVLVKTFSGLKFQEAILKKIAELKHTTYRLSTPEEESKGIDGLVGATPVSIKPHTYKAKMQLQENIECSMIFYEKKDTGLIIEFNF